MIKDLTIRQEQFIDYKQVEALTEMAFKDMPHAGGDEHELVAKLRMSKDFIPFLSLVAQIDNKIVGHILFTRATIGDDVVLTLAPVSVMPEYQCKGVGSQLINVGHEIAKNLGYLAIIVIGHEGYYPKFGYSEAEKFGLTSSIEVPSINFMAMELIENGLADINGQVNFAKEFYE